MYIKISVSLTYKKEVKKNFCFKNAFCLNSFSKCKIFLNEMFQRYNSGIL